MSQLRFLTNVYDVYYETSMWAAFFPGKLVRGNQVTFDLQVPLKIILRLAKV